MSKTDPDAFLFAWNGYSALQLGVRGKHISDYLYQSDADLHELLEMPATFGVYVWEGTVEGHGPVYSDPPQDADAWLEGEVRPATAEDMRAFGVALGAASEPPAARDATREHLP